MAEKQEVEIIYTENINNFKTRLYLRAEEPFVLSVAEGFDPLITAYERGDAYRSIPLFGTINGFIIGARKGQMAVDVVFHPQRWTWIGLWISLVSFLFMLVYVMGKSFHMRHREIND